MMRKHWKNSRIKRKTALVLAVMTGMLSVTSFPAFADSENITGRGGTGYSAERWAALNDDVIEYDELADLVHEFNPSLETGWKTLEDTQKDLQGYVEELENAKTKVAHLEDTAKDELKGGDLSAYSDVVTHTIQKATLSVVIGSFRSSADSLLVSKSNLKLLKRYEKQMVQGAQQLMIACKTVERQKKTMATMAELYQEQYQITLNKQAQGLATDAEVLLAQTNQLYAESLAGSIATYELQLKPQLCTMLGWDASADPTIADIPPVDMAEIDQMNLEEDTTKAIGNNLTLIEQRSSSKGRSSSDIDARNGLLEEGDQKLTIKMKTLYDDVMAKRTAYEAALDGFEAAKKTREKYQRMQEIGYLSRADFIGTEVQYYTEEANYYTAETALRQAVETYHWAIQGLTAIE
jgi:hypothetical protein